MARIQFKKYPLGFWCCYPYDMNGMTRQEVADMADCGMTLTMSPWTNHDFLVPTIKGLDLCEEYGIQLILTDRRTHWSNIKQGEEAYRRLVREAYEDYGHHPATFGFFLGDEPHESQMEACTVAYKIALEELHGLVPYLNQNPGYADKCRKFVRESGCQLLSYDRYSQMNPEPEFVNDFIRDFDQYKKLAEEVDVPMLSIMLSVGHFRYRVPSVDDFRWQMGVALACGANAIFWFTYHTPICNNNYRGGPISEFGEKNPTYYSLKDLQRKFNRDYADLFNHCDWKGVQWFNQEYPISAYVPGEKEAVETYGLLNAGSNGNTPGLITYLDGKDEYAGKHYIMITNNTCDKADLFWIHTPKNKKVWRVYADDEVDFAASHWDASFDVKENYFSPGTYLAPGQFEIYRID